jgi:GNAT superfamily N-acetyltransferase
VYWRDRSLEHGGPKKRAMGQLVQAGREPGLLAYDEGGESVGWVSLGPREDFPPLSPLAAVPPAGGRRRRGGLVARCFTVDRDAQRQGVARALLAAAIEHAFAHGAASLEAYPHRTEPVNHMGHLELFEAAGFASVRETSKRVVMRLER